MTAQNALAALWLALAGMYGSRWTSAMGEEPDASTGAVWANALRGLTAGQIGAALDGLHRDFPQFPPTVHEFREQCLGVRRFDAIHAELNGPRAEQSAFARMVYAQLNLYAYRHATEDQREGMHRKAYTAARLRVLGGELPPEPVQEIAYAAPPPKLSRIAKRRAERTEHLREILGDAFNADACAVVLHPEQEQEGEP